VKKEKLNEI